MGGSPNSYVTKALLKLSNLSDLSKARHTKAGQMIPRAATSKSIPKHLIGQDNNLQSAGGQYGIWPTDSTAGMFDVAKRCIAKFDIHQFIDRTYLRNKVRHIGFLPTALWKTNT